MFSKVWVVQDAETACFLRPHTGDVGYTPFLREAGYFDSEEEAVETAATHCGEGFHVVGFYIVAPSHCREGR